MGANAGCGSATAWHPRGPDAGMDAARCRFEGTAYSFIPPLEANKATTRENGSSLGQHAIGRGRVAQRSYLVRLPSEWSDRETPASTGGGDRDCEEQRKGPGISQKKKRQGRTHVSTWTYAADVQESHGRTSCARTQSDGLERALLPRAASGCDGATSSQLPARHGVGPVHAFSMGEKNPHYLR